MRRTTLLVFLFGTFLISSAALATSVGQELISCPVCGKPFVVDVFRSYRMQSPPPRDLSDGFSFLDVQTCPHCLYTAFQSHLRTAMIAEQRAKLKQWLASGEDLRKRMLALKSEGALDLDHTLDPGRTFRPALALVCMEQSPFTTLDSVAMWRYGYCQTAYIPESKPHRWYRDHLIEALSAALAKGMYQGEEKVTMTYLLGEIQRRAGRAEAALASFASAQGIMDLMPAGKPRDTLSNWCDEQAESIRAETRSVKELEKSLVSYVPVGDIVPFEPAKPWIAVSTLLGRNDTASLASLLRFARKSDQHAAFIGMVFQMEYGGSSVARDRMRGWLQYQYDDAARQVFGTQQDTAKPTRQQLKESFAAALKINERQEYSYDDEQALTRHVRIMEEALRKNPESPQLPADWDSSLKFRVLAVLLKWGNPDAVPCLIAELRSIAPGSNLRYDVWGCLHAVVGSPIRHGLRERALKENHAGNPTLWQLTLLACGDEQTIKTLKQRFQESRTGAEEWESILSGFKDIGHPGLKPILLDHWSTFFERYSGWYVATYGGYYLAKVGTVEDLPVLERFTQDAEPVFRRHIESAIRTIRLRALIQPTSTSSPSPDSGRARSGPQPY